MILFYIIGKYFDVADIDSIAEYMSLLPGKFWKKKKKNDYFQWTRRKKNQ